MFQTTTQVRVQRGSVRWWHIGAMVALFLPLLIFYTSFFHAQTAKAIPAYQNSIPNYNQGTLAADTCGACHSGTLAMKAPFANAGHKWTAALAFADSDGDGFTNGEELQDPMGGLEQWRQWHGQRRDQS